MMRATLLIGPWLLVLLAGTATAEVVNDDLVCPPAELELDKYRYLRALSLDLRGHVPDYEEYRALDELADVPDALIEEWLGSEAFAERAVRRHRELLWNNIRNVEILDRRAAFQKSGQVWFRPDMAQAYRGGTDELPCLDEPATFAEDGSVQTTKQGLYNREGWVYVTPFWAPTTKIKVCAFDAQDTLITPSGNDCSTRYGYVDLRCGCGPNLIWCAPPDNNAKLAAYFTVDLDLRVETLVSRDQSYMDLFTDNHAWVNGPIVHFWKHQAPLAGPFTFAPSPVDPALLPDLAYTDDKTWIEVELPGEHAGILSSVSYLMRFQTNRARANRFYDAFMCQPFNPPSGGIPAATDESAKQADLQQRDGCKYCHALLEPAASHWGRWTELGAAWLDPETYPAYREDCDKCVGCAHICNTYYLVNANTPAEDQFTGMLKAYVYRSEQHYQNIETGPSLLALATLDDGRVAQCASRSTAEWLLGRATTAEEQAFVEGVTSGFADSGYSFKSLVRAVVTSPVYRRVR